MKEQVKHIVLIGNYLPDKQQSMLRFLRMLEHNYLKEGLKVEVVFPTVFFGKWIKNTNSGIGKWLSYLDKYLLFPLSLWLKNKSNTDTHAIYHICDHSNAMYSRFLPLERTIVTCHDVLAIRGAKGHKDAYCDASYFGKILQNWILHSLQKTRKITFVSKTTQMQFEQLCENKNYDGIEKVIYNSMNGDFYPMEITHALNALNSYPQLQSEPFILHVGSGLTRKNRKLVLEVLILLQNNWTGNVCFVGDPLDEACQKLVNENGLTNRVICIQSASHQILISLYRLCAVFMFPSFSEGFGWPVIEAQAAGAPVITSNIEPMPEIAGKNALTADPFKPQEFADAFLYLQNLNNRNQNIEYGFENVKRFEMIKMLNAYQELYNL